MEQKQMIQKIEAKGYDFSRSIKTRPNGKQVHFATITSEDPLLEGFIFSKSASTPERALEKLYNHLNNKG